MGYQQVQTILSTASSVIKGKITQIISEIMDTISLSFLQINEQLHQVQWIGLCLVQDRKKARLDHNSNIDSSHSDDTDPDDPTEEGDATTLNTTQTSGSRGAGGRVAYVSTAPPSFTPSDDNGESEDEPYLTPPPADSDGGAESSGEDDILQNVVIDGPDLSPSQFDIPPPVPISPSDGATVKLDEETIKAVSVIVADEISSRFANKGEVDSIGNLAKVIAHQVLDEEENAKRRRDIADKMKAEWIEDETSLICALCLRNMNSPEVPKALRNFKRGNLGVFKKRKKNFHNINNMKRHSENPLHLWCASADMRKKQEEVEENRKNDLACEMIVQKGLTHIKRPVWVIPRVCAIEQQR